MSCEEFRSGHPSKDEAARSHQAGCGDCTRFARAWDLIGDYPAIEPSAGFFRGIRRKLAPAVLRFAAPLAAAAAVLLVALLLTRTAESPSSPVAVTEEERELVENLDLIQNYDLLRTLELVGENGSPLTEDRK